LIRGSGFGCASHAAEVDSVAELFLKPFGFASRRPELHFRRWIGVHPESDRLAADSHLDLLHHAGTFSVQSNRDAQQ